MPDDLRLTPEQAGLMRVGVGGSACWKCRFWHLDDSCDVVKGHITGDLCCNGYRARGVDAPVNDYKFAGGAAFGPALEAAKAGAKSDLRRE